MSKIECKCIVCGKSFMKYKYDINIGRGKYCSNQCRFVANKKGLGGYKNVRGENHYLWNGGKIKRICKFCKKEFSIAPSELAKKEGSGNFCSKSCSGKYHSGSLSSSWRGGKTSKTRLLRNSIDALNFRKDVMDRDNYTCQKCGKRGGKLNAHHIIPLSKDASLSGDITNGVTLCEECHKKEHQRINKKNGKQITFI